MLSLFEYLKKREEAGKVVLNAEKKPFYGEIHMIFNAGKIVHTKDWSQNDIALIVESRKV